MENAASKGGAVLLGGEQACSTKKATGPQELDDIQILMGKLSPQEHAKRIKLRHHRNVASAMMTQTNSPWARQLCWMVVEWVTPNLYAPAPLEWLDELILFTHRLLDAANQVQLKLNPDFGGDHG